MAEETFYQAGARAEPSLPPLRHHFIAIIIVASQRVLKSSLKHVPQCLAMYTLVGGSPLQSVAARFCEASEQPAANVKRENNKQKRGCKGGGVHEHSATHPRSTNGATKDDKGYNQELVRERRPEQGCGPTKADSTRGVDEGDVHERL